jgi:2-iminobutanoate/2-iminopropanoate deaminase
MSDVVKSTVFVDDMANYSAVNDVYKQYFTSSYPARSLVAVKELPIKGIIKIKNLAKVEIECIAVSKETSKNF